MSVESSRAPGLHPAVNADVAGGFRAGRRLNPEVGQFPITAVTRLPEIEGRHAAR